MLRRSCSGRRRVRTARRSSGRTSISSSTTSSTAPERIARISKIERPPRESSRIDTAISEKDRSVPVIQRTTRTMLLTLVFTAPAFQERARAGRVSRAASLGVRLVFRPCLVEGGKVQASLLDGDDLREGVERHLEASRVEHLGDEATVGA